MNEFIDKLIGRLEEELPLYVGKVKKIVNELAEEYGKDTNVTTNGWIPCSERLPSFDGAFICTAKEVEESLELIYSSFDNSWMDEFDSEYEVIAWQPLPEPYTEVEQE